MNSGVLSDRNLRQLIAAGVIQSENQIESNQIQPATLDLRLGRKAYRVDVSRRPVRHEPMNDLTKHALYELDLSKDIVLEKGQKYLIELNESIHFKGHEKDLKELGFNPEAFWAYANPKSTTGRLHLEVRLISKTGYDLIDEKHDAEKLFLEATPRSFPVRLHEGNCLNQIRFNSGDARVTAQEISRAWEKNALLLDKQENPIKDKEKFITGKGIIMYPDLNGFVGFKAKKEVHEVIDLNKQGYYDPRDFFDELKLNKFNELIIRENEFYLLATKEMISCPIDYSIEMRTYDLTHSGPFKSHFAGFIDPGHGYGKKGKITGSQLTLEVVTHDTVALRETQPVCKIILERMHSLPEKAYGQDSGSSYQMQRGPRLAKQFKQWTE